MPPARPALERLMDKTIPEPNSGCLLWTGAVSNGYGRIGYGPKVGNTDPAIGVHQLSWMLHFGPIPDGLHVCHKCDVRSCVNPRHLFLGTPADNNADKQRKGRAAKKLTPDDVITIRKMVSSGVTQVALAAQYGVSQPAISYVICQAKGDSHERA